MSTGAVPVYYHVGGTLLWEGHGRRTGSARRRTGAEKSHPTRDDGWTPRPTGSITSLRTTNPCPIPCSLTSLQPSSASTHSYSYAHNASDRCALPTHSRRCHTLACHRGRSLPCPLPSPSAPAPDPWQTSNLEAHHSHAVEPPASPRAPASSPDACSPPADFWP